MIKEKNPKRRLPQQGGNGMFAQVQTSVEITSSISIHGKCSEKEYERLFIGHDRLSLSAYIDHVLAHHFKQCEEAIKSHYAKNYNPVF